MDYVLKIIGYADGTPLVTGPHISRFVEEYDPDGRDGAGSAKLTLLRSHAKRFPSKIEALEFWRQQSTKRPTRSDGKPNRPLTSFSVMVEPVMKAAS